MTCAVKRYEIKEGHQYISSAQRINCILMFQKHLFSQSMDVRVFVITLCVRERVHMVLCTIRRVRVCMNTQRNSEMYVRCVVSTRAYTEAYRRISSRASRSEWNENMSVLNEREASALCFFWTNRVFQG